MLKEKKDFQIQKMFSNLQNSIMEKIKSSGWKD